MKKLLLSLGVCISFCVVQAQISSYKLTSDRHAYRAGDYLEKQQVEYKDPGSIGRSLVWDFRILQPFDYEYSLAYFIPDSTEMERICGQEHQTRYYYRQLTDSLLATGYENYTTFMEYTRPELRLKFPLAYGDTLYSEFEGSGEYGRRLPLYVKGYTRVEVDAEGELILPDETVKKTLRVYTKRHYTQTGKDSLEMTLHTWSWYAKGVRYPVFESIKTLIHPKGGKEEQIFTTSFYYPPEKQLSEIDTDNIEMEDEILQGAAAVFTEARTYPNPVTDNLKIDFKLTRDAQVWFSVHNNAGVAQTATAPENLREGHHTKDISMGHLLTGTYTVNVHVDDMLLQLNVVKK